MLSIHRSDFVNNSNTASCLCPLQRDEPAWTYSRPLAVLPKLLQVFLVAKRVGVVASTDVEEGRVCPGAAEADDHAYDQTNDGGDGYDPEVVGGEGHLQLPLPLFFCEFIVGQVHFAYEAVSEAVSKHVGAFPVLW